MKRGQSKPMPTGHGGSTRTVHYLADEGFPICGRTPTFGVEPTEDPATCSWCIRVKERSERSPHRPLPRMCAECGDPWPCAPLKASRLVEQRPWDLDTPTK